MTADRDEVEGDDGNDEELDLDKLFDSIPTDQIEPDTDDESQESDLEDGLEFDEVPGDGSEEGIEAMEERLPADTPETAEEEPAEPSSKTGKSSRFDKYMDGVDTSSEGRGIEELLGRMSGGETSATSSSPTDTTPEQTTTPDDSLGVDDIGDESGDIDSAVGAEEQKHEEAGGSDAPALEGVSELSNVLFKATRSGDADGDVCHPIFSSHSESEQNVLLVTLRQSSEDRLNAFYAESERSPENIAVITSSDSTGSTTTTKGAEGQSDITVKAVNDPGDLTRLGITISNVLSSWQGNGNQTLVCFDSLSSLLQYADLQRVFRFIHVLQGRLGNVDATTHYHLDPAAHDSQTEATLGSLFDGVISVSDAGEITLD